MCSKVVDTKENQIYNHRPLKAECVSLLCFNPISLYLSGCLWFKTLPGFYNNFILILSSISHTDSKKRKCCILLIPVMLL